MNTKREVSQRRGRDEDEGKRRRNKEEREELGNKEKERSEENRKGILLIGFLFSSLFFFSFLHHSFLSNSFSFPLFLLLSTILSTSHSFSLSAILFKSLFPPSIHFSLLLIYSFLLFHHISFFSSSKVRE